MFPSSRALAQYKTCVACNLWNLARVYWVLSFLSLIIFRMFLDYFKVDRFSYPCPYCIVWISGK